MRLFNKTWERDWQWLKMAMITVRKYCDSTVNWTIVLDDGTVDRFQPVLDQVKQQTPEKDLFVSVYQTSDHWKDSLHIPNGYLRQQWIKMTAHRVMANGYFWNWDSDVLAQRHFCVEDFCSHDKPIHWITQFNAIMGGTDDHAHESRKQMLRDIFGVPDVSFEYMRCMPMPMMSEVLQHGEKSSYWDKVFNMCSAGDIRISEFNILGMFAHFYFLDVFEWRNTQNYDRTFSGPWGDKKYIVSQQWSWGQMPESIYKDVMSL